jgi:glucosaminylphosphatidylinositol acyltransferase
MATMDEMTMKTLKQMKEDFVSNLSGGSISEINTVTAVALVLALLEVN